MFKKTDNKSLYIINDLSKIDLIQNWKYNRPPDKCRVNEIKEYIQKNNDTDGLILIAELNNECLSYYCYDGIHRLTAIKELKNEIPDFKLNFIVEITKLSSEKADD